MRCAMRRASLLLVALPGYAWAFLPSGPCSRPSSEATPPEYRRGRSKFIGTTEEKSLANPAARPSTHTCRCRPLFKKGRGGQKQAELMELMAKAQADRAKRELEAQLREKGDLGKEKDEEMPAIDRGKKIKAERSWREGGAPPPNLAKRPKSEAKGTGRAGSSGASGTVSSGVTGETGMTGMARGSGTSSGTKRLVPKSRLAGGDGEKKLAGKGVSGAGKTETTGDEGKAAGGGPKAPPALDVGAVSTKGWGSTRIEGRPNDEEFDYDQYNEHGEPGDYESYDRMLEESTLTTTDPGLGVLPKKIRDPGEFTASYEALKDKAEWEAAIKGEAPNRNRSPVAAEGEYDAFEDMLANGASGPSGSVQSLRVAEREMLDVIDRKVPQTFSRGEFVPLDSWRSLSDQDGAEVNFGLYKGIKPVLVVADPRSESSEMRDVLNELKRMPRKLVDIVAVTVDSPAINRKIVKKSRVTFPVLSDESGAWMQAYRVLSGEQRIQVAFLIEPELGTVLSSWTSFSTLTLVDLVKGFLSEGSSE